MKDKRSNKKVEFDDCSSKSQENEMSMNTSYLSDAYDSFLNDIKQAKRRNNFSNTHILLNQNLSNTNDEGKNDKREFFNAHENETEYSGEEKDRMSVEEKQQLELDEKEEDEVSWLLNSEEILEDDEITERESVLDEDRASEVEKDVEQGKEGENLPENRQSEFSAEDRRQINLVLRQLERPPCILMPLYYLCRSCCSTLRQYRIEIRLRKKHWDSLLKSERIYVKNAIGLICGITLGFMMYFLFLITFSRHPYLSTLLSAYIMLVSVFGLAFSRDFQCIALLVFPYLTASRVRWLIVFYTTGVSVTGPGLNFLHNSGNFRNSIACVIAQVNTNMMILKKLTQAPFALFKSQLENLIGSINSIVERFRQTLSKINFSLIRLTNVMESQASWIHSLIVACGDSVALINQCLAFFNNIYFSCKKAFGFLSGLCKFVRFFAKDTCVSSDVFTELCKKQGAVLEDTLNVTSKTELANQIHGILNVIGRKNLTLSGNLSAIQEITFSSDHTISNKLQQRMDSFIQTVDAVKYIVSWVMVAWTLITMMTLFVQAIMFRRSWLNNDAYNNVYITSAFIEQEKEAIRKGLVPTVPLVRKEKKIYKKLSSISWTLSEKHTAMLASIMLIIWSSSIILVMVTDYAMYTVTDIVIPLFSHDFSKYGSGGDTEEGSRIEDDENYKLHIDGDSSFANIIQSLTGMLNPLKDVALNIDATTCRPTPNPPDFNTYIEIILLLLLAFISVILQVYIMRLRHSIMIWYYPKKAVHRAAWLRTHIKNNRGLYHRIIHKFKTLDIKRNRRAQNISYLGRYLSRHRRIANLLRLLGIQRIMCVFCGSDGNPSKRSEFEEKFTRCDDCGAYYCRACQVILNHMCMLCRSPLFSMAVEVDFEEYSTDEEAETINTRYLRLSEQATTISSDKSEVRQSRISVTRPDM